MTFDEFHQKAWSEHFLDAGAVAARFPAALALVEKPEQVALFARLVAHVEGEHLGRWTKGLELLGALGDHAARLADDAGRSALDRFTRSLRFCGGDGGALDGLSSSDRARVLAVAGPALAAQGAVARGFDLFREAASAADLLDRADPAQRDLAVAGNNLSLGLEEKPGRTAEETELMLFAARTGRRFWEIAGGPTQVMRAEYRLAKSHVAAGNADEAVKHAETALELAAAHSAGDTDVFFLYEALAWAERARGRLEGFARAVEHARERFGRLSEEDREWCEPELKKLQALV
jgi:hypothetical protein